MSRARWFATGVSAVVAAAGLASATPVPIPQADPIGDVIPITPPAQPPGEPQGQPVQPAQPVQPGLPGEDLITELPPMEVAETDADDGDDDSRPLGTPLPELADPLPRTRQGFAIVQALDKARAETIRFAIPVGQQRRWRGLVFRARACELTAADEPMRDAVAYLEIYAQPATRGGPGQLREVFQGWMYATAPGLNPLEHPLYDAWVISCQAEAPSS